MRNLLKVPLQILLILLVLVAGAGGAYKLYTMRRKPPRRKVEAKPPLVVVVKAARADQTVVVDAYGTIMPAQEVTLFPQVSGLITSLSDELVPGGIIKKGDEIARIDPRDYLLTIEKETGAVERALFELKLEEGRQVVAKREWDLLGNDMKRSEAGRDLALRNPHLRNAQASLRAAQSSLEQAKTNLQRTTVRAPFNALVAEEFIDVGQLVTPQKAIANLIGTDQFRAQVSLPMDKLSFVCIPGVSRCPEDGGSAARVVQLTGQGEQIARNGRVVRLLGTLDPKGRMARLFVEIDDPLGLSSQSGPPLLVGAYVRAEIQGRALTDVSRLPREVLRDGDEVWIAEPQGDENSDEAVLRVRKGIEVVCRARDYIIVGKGIRGGELVIKSSLGTPTDGLKVRMVREGPPQSARPVKAQTSVHASAAMAVKRPIMKDVWRLPREALHADRGLNAVGWSVGSESDVLELDGRILVARRADEMPVGGTSATGLRGLLSLKDAADTGPDAFGSLDSRDSTR